MKFIAVVIAVVVALLFAPRSGADTTPEQAAAAICAARGRGASEMDIERVLQPQARSADFFQIEELVLQAEREYCPQYLGGVSSPIG